MPNTSVKRCATPSVIRQTQWDVSAHALILKRLTVPSSGEDTRATGNSLLHLWRNHNVAQAVRKTVWQFLKVTQINACLPLPGMNPGERKAYIHTKAHAQMSAAGLCIIAKNGKQPKCSLNRWMSQTMEYSSTILKRDTLLINARTCGNVKTRALCPEHTPRKGQARHSEKAAHVQATKQAGSRHKQNPLVPWSGTYQPPELEEINVYCLSHPTYGVLL